MKLQDLLYGLLLRSGNDAAVVIANNICSNEKEFVKLMNKKALEIGMTGTTYMNSHGLDEETKNYSTAHDMAFYFLVIFIELQKNIEKLQRLINMKSNQIINLICGIIVINF